MEDLLDQMCARVLRHTDGVRHNTPVPRLSIGMLSHVGVAEVAVCGPGICLVLQGTKHMVIGDQVFDRQRGSVFASLIELPLTHSLHEAPAEKPYVATSITLNPVLIATLEAVLPAAAAASVEPAFKAGTASFELLEAWDRYMALLDTPKDIAALASHREHELVYRLLEGSHGPLLRQLARQEGRLAQVKRAIDWMQQNFDQAMPVKALADMAGMSVPSFNRHFRAATASSPLQYQKMLRLQTARQMLATDSRASSIAHSVGYESASQFNREYSRLFGLTPARDANRLRAAPEAPQLL